MKKFNIIAAVSLNGVIGDSKTNSIPWHLPTDLKYFKSKTKNHTVIMGSRTYKSIGRPLPDRRNVVITRGVEHSKHLINDCGISECYEVFADAMVFERPDFFVIGGERIYAHALYCIPTNLFITIVKANAIGDVRFPIAGEEFLQDIVTIGDNKYSCIHRSNFLKENNTEFQFTQFNLIT